MPSSLTMKLLAFCLVALNSLALAASPTTIDMGGTSTTMVSASAAASTSVDTSPPYSITALPAVESAPSCVFNCLIPIGLADPSGCDDVTENCACLSAPADVLEFLTGCAETVCQSSTSAYAASATSLYESYCNSIYGTATFSKAFAEEASAAAASSSLASVEATQSSSSTKASSTASASASASTTKSDGGRWEPALLFGTLAMGGLFLMIVL